MASDIPFPLGFLHQRLDSNLVLTECLFHPDLSRLGPTRERAIDAVRRNLEETLPKLDPVDLHRRRLGTTATARWVALTLDPPRNLEAWREAVRLRFAAVIWEHGAEAALARVPTLDIEIIAPDMKELEELLEKEVVAALRREGHSASLAKLAWTQRALKFKVDWQSLSVKLPSLKHRAQRAIDESGEEKPSVLKQVATYLNDAPLAPALEMEATVEQIADALTAAERAPRGRERCGQVGRGPRAGPSPRRLPTGRDTVLPDQRGPDRRRAVRVRDVAGALHRPGPRGREEAGRHPPRQPRGADGGRQERIQPDEHRRVPPPGHRPR